MSSNNNPNIQDFIDNLPNIAYQLFGEAPLDVQNVTTSTTATQLNNSVSPPNAFANFISQFPQDGTPPLPSTWNDFMNALGSFTGGGLASTQQLQNQLLTVYGAALNTSETVDPVTGQQSFSGDFSAIVPPAPPNPQTPTISIQLQNAFSSFLSTYQYNSLSTPITLVSFTRQFLTFLSETAVTNTGTFGNSPSPPLPLAAFQQIFSAFFPNANTTAEQQEFSTLLTQFYQQQLVATGNGTTQNGFFIPSQELNNWYSFVQSSYLNTITGTPSTSLSSVTTSASAGVKVLNEVLLLVIAMIGSIENVAAAQANRLNFLNQWQEAYTNLQNQIHYFSSTGNGTGGPNSPTDQGPLDPGATPSKNAENALNSQNQIYVQSIQGDSGVVSNDAKSLQSYVNQSNDEANQQSTLASTILQEMSTIIQSIYSGS
jgi:hypothetical protein